MTRAERSAESDRAGHGPGQRAPIHGPDAWRKPTGKGRVYVCGGSIRTAYIRTTRDGKQTWSPVGSICDRCRTFWRDGR